MSEFNRARAEQAIMEARARDYSKLEIELAGLLERTLAFDLERKTYYNNYVLVKEDWNTLKSVLAKLASVLNVFRESDHSYSRAPTQEGQAVLDAWDEASKTLADRYARLSHEDFDNKRTSQG